MMMSSVPARAIEPIPIPAPVLSPNERVVAYTPRLFSGPAPPPLPPCEEPLPWEKRKMAQERQLRDLEQKVSVFVSVFLVLAVVHSLTSLLLSSLISLFIHLFIRVENGVRREEETGYVEAIEVIW